MAEKTLAKKMKLKAGATSAVVNAPAGYLASLHVPESMKVDAGLAGKFDWVQIFVRNRTELESLLPRVTAALNPGSLLWISFPKGSSGIQTDLTRDQGWDALRDVDLKWINLISVDETWSAFSLRPTSRVRPARAFGKPGRHHPFFVTFVGCAPQQKGLI